MWQQHAIVGAATALPCENERRRALGAERECDPLARWARARLLIAAATVVVAAWSAAARQRFFGILAGGRRQENETWRSVLERSALAEVWSRSVLEAHVREGSHGAAPGLVRPA